MTVYRRYRITPWAVRVFVPLVGLVVILAVVADRAAPSLIVPVVVVLTGSYVYLAERCGLYVTDSGIESRMTRRGDSFRTLWTDIDHFELLEDAAQVAIVMCLADGGRVILPSTKAWRYDRKRVEGIYDQLERDLVSARSHPSAGDGPPSPCLARSRSRTEL